MNYDYWERYNKDIKQRIIDLCNKKDKLKIDLHMHTTYSTDGKQTLQEIIANTKNKFDIIAITDHDNIDAMRELYNIKEKTPIIIPGVEFTIDNSEYGNQAHIVQLFINPCDKIMTDEIEKQNKAAFNRSKIQFKRLKHNKGLQELLNKYNVKLLYSEYKKYLKNNNTYPEYESLIKYIIYKTERYFDNFDVLDLQEKYNNLDLCNERKLLKEKAYEKIRKKYTLNDKHSSRMLLSILGVRTVDDDWFNYPVSGSISVNSYGQLKIEELDKKYLTVFAHPTEDKLKIVEKIIKQNNIKTIEINTRNKYNDIEKLYDMIDKNNLTITKGSDNHELDTKLYDDLGLYEIESKEVIKLCH